MRLEDKFLILNAKVSLNTDEYSKIQHIITTQAQTINWDYLISAAYRHGILPILYRNLKKLCISKLPRVFLNNLQAIIIQNGLRNLMFTRVLFSIFDIFDNNAIQAVPLKGPILSKYVYGDIALRTFSDLDILVLPEDSHRVVELLTINGYMPESILTPTQQLHFMRCSNQIVLKHLETKVPIEIHWELMGPYFVRSISLNELIERTEFIQVEGKKLKVLGLEDLLIYLCVHGSKHRWGRLEWIFCVAVLISNRSDIDWDVVINRAQNWHCFRMLLLGLYLVHDFLNVTLPSPVKKMTEQDTSLPMLAKKVRQELFSKADESEEPWRGASIRSFQIHALDSIWDATHFTLKLIFKPTFEEWNARLLPNSFTFLLYGIRPLRLLWRYLARIAGINTG